MDNVTLGYTYDRPLKKFASNSIRLWAGMQLKSWLRAIHTHVNKWHAKDYFDEFCFRINCSQFK